MKRSLDGLMKMKSKTDEQTAGAQPGSAPGAGAVGVTAKYLKQPVKPDSAFAFFLAQARKAARNFLPKEIKLPVTRPFCEIECRIGVLKAPFGVHEMRVTSSGPKHVPGKGMFAAFQCDHIEPRCNMESGISRSHFSHWTQAGLSEVSPISRAFGVTDVQHIKRDLQEKEYVETVYAGYPEDRRVCFPGLHPSSESVVGTMEYKDKLFNMDLAIPAAGYDARITLSAEKSLDSNVRQEPPPGWTMKRIKRRRSYSRRDDSFAWQLDITEVTTSSSHNKGGSPDVSYEIEMEIIPKQLLQLINENDEQKVKSTATKMASQLWWMLQQINPLSDVSDVEDFLKDHPSSTAVRLALAQCAALKTYLDHQKSSPQSTFTSPVGAGVPSGPPPTYFMGCMPVNFSRHNIEEIQRAPDNAYFCSEKTDGVRHLLVFTGDTAVLVDRAMRGKQPIVTTDPAAAAAGNSNKAEDPMHHILPLIMPGTVLDGEVVMNRKYKRPIFIVFDVMCCGTQPVLQLPFEQRLQHLRRASFRTRDANRDMFDPKDITRGVALPLVRKNFVPRTGLAELISNVVEEKGMRSYRNGDLYDHLTDGIIFQPNLPYVCGTDVNLLKWKYLDTVTIDVELLKPQHGNHRANADDEDVLRVGCMGEEGTSVDMTRYVHLPKSERLRLEADRAESGGNIAEVGFDPETGEWYYLTMRSDKKTPNHISTVLGTLLELAESLTTEELIYRMSIPSGGRDSYRKDFRGMLKQLLEFQKKKMKTTNAPSSSSQSHR